MYYVYILRSDRDNKLYVGCTNDLNKRIKQHNGGAVAATKNRRPFTLLFFEVFNNKQDAFAREQWLKSGYGRTHMKKMLLNTLKSLGG